MVDFTIKQGSTWQRVLRWESPVVTYKPITAIARSAPVSITATGHGVPDGWRVAVQSVQGMRQINATNNPPRTSDYRKATVSGADTLTLNSVNALEYSAYTSGGVVVYNTPVDMSGYTARMQIKARLTDTVSLVELTTNPGGGIVIDNVAKTIALTLTATQTAALAFTSAVFSLEMVSSDGVVTELVAGALMLEKEITR